MRVAALLLTVYFTVGPLPYNSYCTSVRAQSSYDGQIEAIEDLLRQERYDLALIQSEALLSEGQAQQLTNVQAYGHYLRGRTLLERPQSGPQDRIRGVKAMRRASRAFSNLGMTATVDSITDRMRTLGGGSVEALPTVRQLRRQNRLDDTLVDEELDETTLSAIVNLQNEHIEALSDSQLRQLIALQQKDLQIDSFEYEVMNDSLALLHQTLLLDEQRARTREERQRRNFFILLAGGVLLALGLLYSRFRSSQRYQRLLSEKNARIEEARQQTDELLANMLPAPIARELKRAGKATARRHEEVTVMFSDFVGFSRFAAGRDPEELVRLLDETFRGYDEIVRQHGLEKIKTIGDAYMCVAGLPDPDPDHAARAVRAAFAIQAYLKEHSPFAARIGVHSGPVVAGVVGRDKFAYDIWGDTVNQAARLEGAARAGEVCVSEATRALLSEAFTCTYAGEFQAKNIGTLKRYVVQPTAVGAASRAT